MKRTLSILGSLAALFLYVVILLADVQTPNVRDAFNRAANLDLSASAAPLKWKKITDPGNTDQTWQINADSSISAYDPTPSGTPIIEIGYDSLFAIGSSMIGLDLKNRTGIYDGANTGLGLGFVDTLVKAQNIGVRAAWYPPSASGTSTDLWELEFISAANGGGQANHIGTSTIMTTWTAGSTAWLISKPNNVWTLRINYAAGGADSISETYAVDTRTTLRPLLISKFITGYPSFDNFRVGVITLPPPPVTDLVAPTVSLAQVSPTNIDSLTNTDVTFRICDTCAGSSVKAKLDSCYAYVDSGTTHLISKVFKIWNSKDTTFTMGARLYHPGSYTYYVKRLRDSTGNISDPAMTAKNFTSNIISPPVSSNINLKTVVYAPQWIVCAFPPEKWDWNAFNYLIWFWGAPQATAPYYTLYAGSSDSTTFETGVPGWCTNATGRTHQQVMADSALKHGVNLILGIAAEVGNPASTFATVIADTTPGGKQDVMIAQVTGFAQRHGYKGIDVNWEYVTRSAAGRAYWSRFLYKVRAILDTWSPKGTLSFSTADWYWWNVNGGGGIVNGVGVLKGGSGYTSAPTVTWPNGGTGTATVSNGQVTKITVNTAGTNNYYGGGGTGKYPAVTISGGGGSGATAVLTSGGEPLMDMSAANNCLDWVFLEGYGLQGSTVGSYASLYYNPQISGNAFWDDDHLGMNEWVAAGLQKSKLCAALPFECLSMTAANGNLGTPVSGPSWIGYADIPQSVKDNPTYDPVSKGSWGFSGGKLYMFEIPQTVNDKVQFCKERGFGYIGAWELYREFESASPNRMLDALKAANANTDTTKPVPSSPGLASPANGATGVTFNSTPFRWHPSTGATQYRIQIATDPNFTLPLTMDQVMTNGLNDTATSISLLQDSKTFYWHVAAGNSTGFSTFSGTSSFTTIAKVVATPGVPVLNLPANAATSQSITPTLTWFPVYIDSTTVPPTLATYDLQVSSNSGFTSLLFQFNGINGTSSTLSSPLSYSSTYYWRLRAKNGTDSSAYSTGRSFTTVTAPVNPPTQPNTVKYAYQYGSGQIQKPGIPDYTTRHVKDPTQTPIPPAGNLSDYGLGVIDEFGTQHPYFPSHVTSADSAKISDSVRYLRATGVAPGTYTNVTITVGPDGRILSASTGTGSSMHELGQEIVDSLNLRWYTLIRGLIFNSSTTDSGKIQLSWNGTREVTWQAGNGFTLFTLWNGTQFQIQDNITGYMTYVDGKGITADRNVRDTSAWVGTNDTVSVTVPGAVATSVYNINFLGPTAPASGDAFTIDRFSWGFRLKRSTTSNTSGRKFMWIKVN